MGCGSCPGRRRAPECYVTLFRTGGPHPWRMPSLPRHHDPPPVRGPPPAFPWPLYGWQGAPTPRPVRQVVNLTFCTYEVPVPLMPCDNTQSQPRTTTRVCCPEWPQGKSTLPVVPAPSATWRLKPGDRGTGEDSGVHTVMGFCPSHGVSMVQAVDWRFGSRWRKTWDKWCSFKEGHEWGRYNGFLAEEPKKKGKETKEEENKMEGVEKKSNKSQLFYCCLFINSTEPSSPECI